MKVHYDIPDNIDKNAVVTLGFFDGLHCGHKKIIAQLKREASKTKSKTIVITFWPHARYVLGKDPYKLKLISTLDEKIDLFKKEGIDNLLVLDFTKEFANLTADEFISKYLVKKLSISQLLVGYNHKFGSDGIRDINTLKTIAKNNNFEIIEGEIFISEDKKVSSSVIRELIQNGKIEQANKMLDYDFFISGKVVKGNTIGKSIGFPTANIQVADENKLCPKNGVYVSTVKIESKEYQGMLYIGDRPTFTELNNGKRIEVNIFNFNENLYDKEISIFIKNRIRDDEKFESIEKLKEQLIKDKFNTEEYFSKK